MPARLWSRLQVLILVLMTACLPAFSQPSPSPSPSPGKDGAVYLTYLKDPASLGFKPDAALFGTVLQKIASTHADSPTDAMLYAGVAGEVHRLLEAARLPTDGLASIPRDRDLPQAVVRRWGDQVDARVLWYAMTCGLFKGTGDEHSYLMTPREYKRLMEGLQNEGFVGVGIFVELDRDNHDQLTVVEPVEGAPAAKAGVLARDEIIRIDGKPTEHLTVDAASTLIRGPAGSRVVLTVRRGSEVRDYSIERAAIKVPSVTSRMLPDGIGYVRVRMFGAKTDREFREAVADVMAHGARGMVLDLRNNGGGYNTAAASVCGRFLDPDTLVTYMIDKRGGRREYKGGNEDHVHVPVVVLVNKYSASAAEITTACLRDHEVATIVGTRTFGKGSSQQLLPLPDGAGFRVTFAHFFSPKGTRIDRVGIEPDVKVEMDVRLAATPDKDVQLKKAVEILTRPR